MKRAEINVTFRNGEDFAAIYTSLTLAKKDYLRIIAAIDARGESRSEMVTLSDGPDWGYYGRVSEIVTVEFKEAPVK
jgi:hypothetical protein